MQRRVHSRILFGLSLFTALSLGCDQPVAQPEPPAPPRFQEQPVEVSTADSADGFSGTIAVEIVGQMDGMTADTARGFSYDIERSLLADGTVRSVMRVTVLSHPDVTSADPSLQQRPARIEQGDGGVRIYDGQGRLVQAPDLRATAAAWPRPVGPDGSTLPDPLDTVRLIDPGTTGMPNADPSLRAAVAVASPPRVAVTRAPDDGGWLDNVIVSRRSAERARTRLEAIPGVEHSRVGRARRYVVSYGSTRNELDVDEETGALLEERMLQDGQLQMRAVHDYTRARAGDYLVRTATRRWIREQRARGGSVRINEVLANVKLTRRVAP